MTGIMKLPNPTAGLWLGNALGISLLLLIVVYQLGGAGLDLGAQLPQVLPLAAQPVTHLGLEANAGNRNPFDPSATRWKISGENNPAITGELRGVILLPGVQAVVTSSGAVHLGESLTEGRITRISGNKVIVEQGNGSMEMELPSARLPTLQSINKAKPGLDTTKGSK